MKSCKFSGFYSHDNENYFLFCFGHSTSIVQLFFSVMLPTNIQLLTDFCPKRKEPDGKIWKEAQYCTTYYIMWHEDPWLMFIPLCQVNIGKLQEIETVITSLTSSFLPYLVFWLMQSPNKGNDKSNTSEKGQKGKRLKKIMVLRN